MLAGGPLAGLAVTSPTFELHDFGAYSTHHRTLNAALHRLAADVELATPASERWCVQSEAFYDDRGIVYLELADATATEADRGMAVLRALVP